jgi:iron complex transport system ATP-binding protein
VTDTSKPAVEIDRATVRRGEVEILEEISLSIRADEHLAILGPNGSGKSTIVGLIAGDVPAVYREPAPVRLFGETSWNLFELRERLGIVSDRLQTRQEASFTVMEVLLSAFFGSVGLPLRAEIAPEMYAKAKEVAAFLKVSNLLERDPATLSSGQMRRVLVGRALVHDPDMLLLDEPFTSLDIAARHRFSLLLRDLAARGHAIVLVSHELSEIPPEIERIVLVKNGRIHADGPKAEILTSTTISDLYGLDLHVERRGDGYHCSVDD